MILDEYKDAGVWRFRVKQYVVLVCMNSSTVSFQIFGRIGGWELDSPYTVKRNRRARSLPDGYIRLLASDHTEKEIQIYYEQFAKFAAENGLDPDITTPETLSWEQSALLGRHLEKYNDSVLGVDFNEFRAKYGDEYQNVYTRHALRTLRQFLKNMLTPIWIRDLPYNIKGRMDFDDYARYQNNIKIEYYNE